MNSIRAVGILASHLRCREPAAYVHLAALAKLHRRKLTGLARDVCIAHDGLSVLCRGLAAADAIAHYPGAWTLCGTRVDWWPSEALGRDLDRWREGSPAVEFMMVRHGSATYRAIRGGIWEQARRRRHVIAAAERALARHYRCPFTDAAKLWARLASSAEEGRGSEWRLARDVVIAGAGLEAFLARGCRQGYSPAELYTCPAPDRAEAPA